MPLPITNSEVEVLGHKTFQLGEGDALSHIVERETERVAESVVGFLTRAWRELRHKPNYSLTQQNSAVIPMKNYQIVVTGSLQMLHDADLPFVKVRVSNEGDPKYFKDITSKLGGMGYQTPKQVQRVAMDALSSMG